MGFRSTMISEAPNAVNLPEWFTAKWHRALNFSDSLSDRHLTFPISTKYEKKRYMPEIEEDLQKVIKEDLDHNDLQLVIIWLHECGGITRAEITKDSIVYSEPTKWKIVEDVTHNYCWRKSRRTSVY